MARDLHKYRLRRPRELSGPVLRGIASWPLLPTLVLTVGSGVAVILGAYWLIARFVPIGDQPMTAAQRLTAAFATATAAGALVALVVNVRKQDLSEQAARRDFESAFTERFRAAASQLGAVSPAERLAGVYAMASLADEYPRRRQQCVDVLCGYLRVPFDPAVDELAALTTDTTHSFADGKTVTSHATMAARPHDLQVRSTIISVIHARTRPEVETSWSHLNFDFTGARLHNLKFQGSIFSGEDTSFLGATFSGERTLFSGATFSGKRTSFSGATFSGEDTSFLGATFSGEETWFGGATFSGQRTWFGGATFSGEGTSFSEATFSGKRTSFSGATFSGEDTSFSGATFSGEDTSFGKATFSGERTWFDGATFSGQRTWFDKATFSGQLTSFDKATFSGQLTSFDRATFSGQRTSFDRATFSGQRTSFDGATFSGQRTSFDRATFSGERTLFDDATFFGVQVTFDAARKIGDAIVSGLEQPQLGKGATIKAYGRPFHGWPDPAVQTPAFPDGDTMD